MNESSGDGVLSAMQRERIAEARRRSRLRVRVADQSVTVLRVWKNGFALPPDAPRLRGRVNLFDGPTHVAQCLVVATGEDGDERRYEYKRTTRAETAPAADYVRPDGGRTP